MDTFAELLDFRPRLDDELGRACGVSRGTVKSWRERNSVPPEHWSALRSALVAHGRIVELADLVRMAERRAKQ